MQKTENDNKKYDHQYPSPVAVTTFAREYEERRNQVYMADQSITVKKYTIQKDEQFLQVLVDVDDTIISSGGMIILHRQIGGIDRQYKRGEFYPGVCQFIFELALINRPKGFAPLSVGILTARISNVPITLDSEVCRKFESIGKRANHPRWGVSPQKIMYSTINEWIFPSEKGNRKYNNFEQLDIKLARVVPNLKYVWIGDTGEMDLDAGKIIAEKYPQKLLAIYMHFVTSDDEFVEKRGTVPRCDIHNGVPIIYFRTYIGAAVEAFHRKHILLRSLVRVMTESLLALDKCDIPVNSSRWIDILRDCERAEPVASLDTWAIPSVQHANRILMKKKKEFSILCNKKSIPLSSTSLDLPYDAELNIVTPTKDNTKVTDGH